MASLEDENLNFHHYKKNITSLIDDELVLPNKSNTFKQINNGNSTNRDEFRNTAYELESNSKIENSNIQNNS
jgi:hypothetical protein